MPVTLLLTAPPRPARPSPPGENTEERELEEVFFPSISHHVGQLHEYVDIAATAASTNVRDGTAVFSL